MMLRNTKTYWSSLQVFSVGGLGESHIWYRCGNRARPGYGIASFPRWESLANGKNWDQRSWQKIKVATLGNVTLRRGNKCYSTLEKYYLKNAPSLKRSCSYPWVHCPRGVTKFYCCLWPYKLQCCINLGSYLSLYGVY